MSNENTIDNTREIAEQIFTKPPCPADSIKLYLEEQTSDLATRTNTERFINEILSVITMHGIDILYGHRDLSAITIEQADKVYAYVRSFGYDVVNVNGKYEFVRIKNVCL